MAYIDIMRQVYMYLLCFLVGTTPTSVGRVSPWAASGGTPPVPASRKIPGAPPSEPSPTPNNSQIIVAENVTKLGATRPGQVRSTNSETDIAGHLNIINKTVYT